MSSTRSMWSDSDMAILWHCFSPLIFCFYSKILSLSVKFLAFLYGSDKGFDWLYTFMSSLSCVIPLTERMSVARFLNWLQLQEHVVTFKNPYSPQRFSFFFFPSSSRDGRMLFDYLAEKHGVSNSTDSTAALCSSHDFCVNPALFQGASGRGGAERGDVKWLPKTLTHFQGFLWLAEFFCRHLHSVANC